LKDEGIPERDLKSCLEIEYFQNRLTTIHDDLPRQVVGNDFACGLGVEWTTGLSAQIDRQTPEAPAYSRRRSDRAITPPRGRGRVRASHLLNASCAYIRKWVSTKYLSLMELVARPGWSPLQIQPITQPGERAAAGLVERFPFSNNGLEAVRQKGADRPALFGGYHAHFPEQIGVEL
jgi:hypothetical protein